MTPTRLLPPLLLAWGLISSPSTSAGWGDLLAPARQLLDGGGGPAASPLAEDEVARALKQALELGTWQAVAQLGRAGGYLDDPQVRIPLPSTLKALAQGMRMAGQGRLVDDFSRSINRAAEQAVPQAAGIFAEALRNMTLADARAILQGGDTAATDYFRRSSGERLRQALLPIVRRTTAENRVTASYKSLLAQSGVLGAFLNTDALDLDRYVTDRALDGLFLKLAEQERLLRRDPAARTTELLRRVFGAARG